MCCRKRLQNNVFSALKMQLVSLKNVNLKNMYSFQRQIFSRDFSECVCTCASSLFIFQHLCVFVWCPKSLTACFVLDKNVKLQNCTAMEREWEPFSFVDFHWNKPAHQRKLFKNPREWQMCSTTGQMSGVWRAVCVFSKYSGITTVYGYNPLVTWNVKDNTKALMPCSKQFGQAALEEQVKSHLSLSCERRPKRGDVVF